MIPKPNHRLYVVIAIVFLSGMTGLIYEISWSRQIGAFFGHTLTASSVTVAAYFAGMALGYAAGSSNLACRTRPVRAYGICELFIGVWAFAFPAILQTASLDELSSWFNHPSSSVQIANRSIFCFLVLLPATFAMGVTLPMIANWVTQESLTSEKSYAVDSRRSQVYAINTLGGLLGVLLATFFLLVFVGVTKTSFLAATISLFCGVVALWLGTEHPPSTFEVACQSEQAAGKRGGVRLQWYFLSTVSGFTTFALQVLYSRLFSLVFHNSTYTFGAVISVFLASLAAGALIQSRFRSIQATEMTIGVALALGAILTAVSVLVFLQWTKLEYFSSGVTFSSYLLHALVLVTAVVSPPIAALGVILPATWQGVAREVSQGKEVGSLACANAAASALGASIANFVLLPLAGLWIAFLLIVVLLALTSLLLFKPRGRSSLMLVLAPSIGFLSYIWISAAAFYEDESLLSHERLVKRWNSPYGMIDLIQNHWTGVSKVRQNLHYRFGSTGKTAREFRQTHLPLVLHPEPKDVLFLGMGTGLTAGAAIPHKQVQTIEVVELIPEVVEAAKLLHKENYNLIYSEKVRVHVNDGRAFIRSTSQRYDVIVSDLFVPWESETGYLYTVEQYQLVKKRLQEKGLFCQCLPLYQLGSTEFELIADSLASVFSNVEVWWIQTDAKRPIVALLAYDSFVQNSVEVVEDRLHDLWSEVGVADDVIATADCVLGLYQGNWASRANVLLNTDEHPRVEFLNPISHQNGIMLQQRNLEEYFTVVFEHLPFLAQQAPLEDQRDAMRKKRNDDLRFILFQK